MLALTAIVGSVWAGSASATTTPEASTETLVVGRTGDVDNLDPHLATAFQTIDALELVYDSLTELAPDLTVQPGLATEWAYNDDGTELTFTLREGVTFHDGSELTSEDVVASLERILDEETAAAGRGFLLSIEEITAPDDLTVVLTLSTADATLPAALSRVNTSILSSDDITAETVATAAQRRRSVLVRRMGPGPATRPRRLRGLLGRRPVRRRRQHSGRFPTSSRCLPPCRRVRCTSGR